jgi:hypothetical protein
VVLAWDVFLSRDFYYHGLGNTREDQLWFFATTIHNPSQYAKKTGSQQYTTQQHERYGYPAMTLVHVVFQGNMDPCKAKIENER